MRAFAVDLELERTRLAPDRQAGVRAGRRARAALAGAAPLRFGAKPKPGEQRRVRARIEEHARLERLVAWRWLGMTLDALAQAEGGITRERVRQLLTVARERGMDVPTVADLRALRERQREDALDFHRESVRDLVFARGLDPLEAARELGLPPDGVLRLAAQLRSELALPEQVRRRALNRAVECRYSDEDLVAALRRYVADALVDGTAPTSHDYVLWRDRQPDRDALPSVPLFSRRGGWAENMRLAGWSVRSRPGGRRKDYTPPGACLGALARCAAETGRLPSVVSYTMWRSPEDPSAQVIRLRFGKWTDALAALAPTLR